MARAQIDLDDPAKGRDDAGSNSADDLLAQLAGDEVDRMLSEADAAAPEALNVDRAVPAGAGGTAKVPNVQPATAVVDAPTGLKPADNADAVLQATEAALDDLFDELNAGGAISAEKQTPQSPPAQPTVDKSPAADKQSIEEVITQRAQDLIAQARLEADTDPAPPASLLSPAETDESLSAADALAAEMEADEREHLEALKRMKAAAGDKPQATAPPANFSAPAPGDIATPTEIDEEKVDFSPPDKSDRVPLLVRILEWINAPLANLSDQVRAGIGKIAIVTTLNAVAIFLYVVIFRRH